MSSRFTATEKWKDSWFGDLPVESKLLFIYIVENCDIAGFWEINFKVASFETGIPRRIENGFEGMQPVLDIEGAFKPLASRFVIDEKYVWVRNFLYHQKNLPLNPENKCHKGILRIIESHNSFGEQILKEIEKRENCGATKGLHSPTGIGTGIGKGKSKGNIIFSFETKSFNGIIPEEMSRWSEAYPAVDIAGEIRRAAEWLLSNPTKRKSNYRRFLINWFSRTQERGGSKKNLGGVETTSPKTRLFPITGKSCSKPNCKMPAVYKDTSGSYDTYLCTEHLPESVKKKYQ